MPRTSIPLSPESCRTLLALLAAHGNATVAARDLNINQASMSKRLKPLQHASTELPRPWLEKKGKRFVLTQEGRDLLPAIEEAVRWWQDFTGYVHSGRPAAVRFACGHEAVGGFVLEAVTAFVRERPTAPLRVSVLRGKSRIRRVALGVLDLAAVTDDEARIHRLARRELHVEQLFSDPLQLVCADRGPSAAAFERLPKGPAVTAEHLLGFPLILPDAQSSLRQAFNGRLRAAGVLEKVRVVLELGGWPTVDRYVRKELGVALLPRSLVARHRGGLLVRDLHPDLAPPNVVRLICRQHPTAEGELDLSEPAQVFLGLLRTEARRWCPEEPLPAGRKKQRPGRCRAGWRASTMRCPRLDRIASSRTESGCWRPVRSAGFIRERLDRSCLGSEPERQRGASCHLAGARARTGNMNSPGAPVLAGI